MLKYFISTSDCRNVQTVIKTCRNEINCSSGCSLLRCTVQATYCSLLRCTVQATYFFLTYRGFRSGSFDVWEVTCRLGTIGSRRFENTSTALTFPPFSLLHSSLVFRPLKMKTVSPVETSESKSPWRGVTYQKGKVSQIDGWQFLWTNNLTAWNESLYTKKVCIQNLISEKSGHFIKVPKYNFAL
jgi:hypothetical protein